MGQPLKVRCSGGPPVRGFDAPPRCYGPCTPERQRTKRPTIDLADELEGAVERNEFGLEYQPIIDLGHGGIAAVEALLRWRHPLMGTIAPAKYLPIAEETGLIVPIGERVLDTATRQLRTWHLGFARMQSLKMHINISARQLTDDGLMGHLQTVLQRSDLDADSLTLELGMGTTTHRDSIEALAGLGLGLALEDFGHGSALDDVRDVPVTTVKLHPSFAGMAAGSADDVAFAEGLLALCRARGLDTIGKGVETREQARRLAVMGCDMAQGYLYSKPLGSEGIGTLLARGRVTSPRGRPRGLPPGKPCFRVKSSRVTYRFPCFGAPGARCSRVAHDETRPDSTGHLRLSEMGRMYPLRGLVRLGARSESDR